jgi:enoyl-CoA hydratase/carnithine racemase
MSDDLIQVDVNGHGVAHIALNRPDALNALSRQLTEQLAEAVQALDRAPEVRVLLLSSRGRHFCAGADIKEMSGIDAAEALRTGFTGCCHQLAAVSKPVVCAVQGRALGGGCELVEMCDVVIAAADAAFAHPEVTLGAMPGAGGTQRLPRAVGRHKALDLLLTGRAMGAEEAERVGLVSRIVPPDRLMDEALEVARHLARLSLPALRMIKEGVGAAFDTPLRDGLAIERALFHRSLALDDAREGMAAFLEKRRPAFTGR